MPKIIKLNLNPRNVKTTDPIMGPIMSPTPPMASNIAMICSASSGQIREANEYVAMFSMAEAIPWTNLKKIDRIMMVAWPPDSYTKPKLKTETPIKSIAKPIKFG